MPNTTITYVPWSPELDTGKACGVPKAVQTHDEWKGKKVVVVAVPGAFTPTWCVARSAGRVADVAAT